jgi:hypothetical protein
LKVPVAGPVGGEMGLVLQGSFQNHQELGKKFRLVACRAAQKAQKTGHGFPPAFSPPSKANLQTI